MFSKKMVVVGIILVITANIVALSVSSRRYSPHGLGRFAIFFVAPLQHVVVGGLKLIRDTWNHYFILVSVSRENDKLKKELEIATYQNSQRKELALSNARLRKLLDFRKNKSGNILSAEVVARDPSPWFKTIIIDKGSAEKVVKGVPVFIPDGIAGQVIDVSSHYSKVLLINDRNSSVDALVQRTRTRGIIQGESVEQCRLKYVLRKHDIQVRDVVISSGLDGVYPKGFNIGYVSGIVKRNSGMFQEVTVTPYVDFEKLEEVLVLINYSKPSDFELSNSK